MNKYCITSEKVSQTAQTHLLLSLLKKLIHELHFRLTNRRDLQTVISSSKVNSNPTQYCNEKTPISCGKSRFYSVQYNQYPSNISNNLEVPHNLLGQSVSFWPFVYSITCQQKQQQVFGMQILKENDRDQWKTCKVQKDDRHKVLKLYGNSQMINTIEMRGQDEIQSSITLLNNFTDPSIKYF